MNFKTGLERTIQRYLNFYKTILKKSKKENKLLVTDQQKGCPTNTNNLAKYVAEKIMLKNIKFGIYHFTDGKAMTWLKKY